MECNGISKWKIINKADNDEYSYLYWEGLGEINYDFSSGFVVKKEDTAKFLIWD